MAHQLKKIIEINQERVPAFKTTSKGGYLEEDVDKFLTGFFEKDIAHLVHQHNHAIDLLSEEETRNEELLKKNQNLHDEIERLNSTVVDEDEVLRLRAELAFAEQKLEEASIAHKSQITELSESFTAREEAFTATAPENAGQEIPEEISSVESDTEAVVVPEEYLPVPEPELSYDETPEDDFTSEATAATTLLAAAERTANEYLATAQATAEQIIQNAEEDAWNVRSGITELEARKHALKETLLQFLVEQHNSLESHPIFAQEEENAAIEITDDITEEEVAQYRNDS